MQNYESVVSQFKRIADNELWHRVDESFLIGVNNPADKQIYWCSLMGKDEELYGVSMYRGASGLYSYEYIRKKDDQRPDPEMATVQDTILVTLDEEGFFRGPRGVYKLCRGLRICGRYAYYSYAHAAGYSG